MSHVPRGHFAATESGDGAGTAAPAGAARAQADMKFVEVSSGKVVMVTADRRKADAGAFGGSDREHLRESFDDMARDLAKFLVRLSKGEAPKE